MSIDLSTEAVAKDRDRLLELLRERSFERRKVILASGRESEFYVDVRKTALNAEGHALIGKVLLSRIPEGVVAVGGLTLGADPLASAVSLTSFLAGRPLEAFLVRKEAKRHGTARWIEHPGLPDGAKVVVLEDVVTSGGSSLKAVERVREAGWEPVKILALVDRLEGGREAIEAEGLTLESLFTRDDFMPEGG